VLADIGENQIGRDRRVLVVADLAPFALDVVLMGKGEAALRGERRTQQVKRDRRDPAGRRSAFPRDGFHRAARATSYFPAQK
jgi:hypothetical protein